MTRGIDDVVTLYTDRGGAAYGEGVTQVEHAVQCALLAQAAAAPPPLVAAALLHDIGHLLGDDDAPGGNARHEICGARTLGALFGRAVQTPVALHIAAKRYLCAVEPAYFDGLSDASRASLALQGGPFDAAAAAVFARRPGAAAAIALRRWDDRAKSATPANAAFADFVPLLRRLARVG